MRIGFVGAGKVGCSLGRYFGQKHELVGYSSRSASSAEDAARMTGSIAYANSLKLCQACDVLFITTPDSAIASAWHELRRNAAASQLSGKIVCHCSGAMPSTVLDGAREASAFAYSLHPLFAIPSKTTPVEELAQAFFTLEGAPKRIEEMSAFVQGMGNRCQRITAEAKTRYHAAAALASNHVVALYRLASDELVACGFAPAEAEEALAPLFFGNAGHIAAEGCVGALTGPAERGDTSTIEKHLACLEGDTREVYRLLNKTLLRIAEEKHSRNR